MCSWGPCEATVDRLSFHSGQPTVKSRAHSTLWAVHIKHREAHSGAYCRPLSYPQYANTLGVGCSTLHNLVPRCAPWCITATSWYGVWMRMWLKKQQQKKCAHCCYWGFFLHIFDLARFYKGFVSPPRLEPSFTR